jgi:phosphate:Na+ symporter
MLASIGKPRDAVRASMVHVIFNTAGVAVWFGFTEYLAEIVRWLSPASPELQGAARMQAETPRQIANAHTVFNVSATLLFIWFTPLFARVVERLVPDRDLAAPEDAYRRSLDDILVHTPSLALDVVRMELARLGASALRMVKECPDPVLSGGAQELDDLQQLDNDVDRLHGALITYLGRLSLEALTGEQSVRLSQYIAAANYFENIGDMIETNLVDAGRERLERGLEISPSTKEVLRALHEKVQWSVEQATTALASEDAGLAQEVLASKADVNQLVEEAEAHLTLRLSADEPHRLAAYRLESELVEALKRVYYFAKRVAKITVDLSPAPPAVPPRRTPEPQSA